MNLKHFYLSITFVLLTVIAKGQLNMPAPSPSSTVTQQVGLTSVSITYSRPSAKGRQVMGEMVPMDKVWRTGANAATKITLSDDLKVGGKTLKAGDYALFTIPGKKEWTIIFSSKAEQNGSFDYDEADDALRITAPASAIAEKVESFTIFFGDLMEASATLNMMWEKTVVSFKLEDTDVDAQVMAQIDQMMNGNIENYLPYFQAAGYYFAHDEDLDQAVEWSDKAAAMAGDKYWVLHLQAKTNAKKGNKKVALQAAKRSMELAKEAGNAEYIAFNEKIIESLK